MVRCWGNNLNCWIVFQQKADVALNFSSSDFQWKKVENWIIPNCMECFLVWRNWMFCDLLLFFRISTMFKFKTNFRSGICCHVCSNWIAMEHTEAAKYTECTRFLFIRPNYQLCKFIKKSSKSKYLEFIKYRTLIFASSWPSRLFKGQLLLTKKGLYLKI